MIDLTTIEGLTPEQIAAIEGQVEGLKNKNTELLGEKKSAVQLAQDKDQVIEEARQAAVTAEEEKLVAEGNYKEALALREKEKATLIAEAQQKTEIAQSALLSRDKTTELGKAMGLIHESHKWSMEDKLSNMLNVSYNDQGQLVTEYKHEGGVVATNVDELKSWASEQDSFKKVLNGVSSSGAGVTTSTASGSMTTKKYSDLTLSERAKLNSQ